MGAIVSDFPLLPQDDDPNRVRLYAAVYSDLAARNRAVPATSPSAISRAELLAHLQEVAGTLVADEIASDETERGYSTLSDADAASTFYAAFTNRIARRLEGSDSNGYLVTAATLSGLRATTALGALAGFRSLIVDTRYNITRIATIRFRNNTLTPALRGTFMRVDDALDEMTLTFAVRADQAAVAGDRFDLISINAEYIQTPRVSVVLVGLPYAPSILTPSDIAAARS